MITSRARPWKSNGFWMSFTRQVGQFGAAYKKKRQTIPFGRKKGTPDKFFTVTSDKLSPDVFYISTFDAMKIRIFVLFIPYVGGVIMGAAFEVQVMTGRESAVKKLLEWAFDRNEQAQKWVKAVHAFTQGTAKLLNSKLGKRVERPIVPGYIFVEMNYNADDENYTAYLSAEIWHLIRRVPGVLKLFADAGQIIGTETFQQLFGRLDTQDQVEITVPDQEAEIATACAAYNDADTPEARKEAEQELKQIESLESRIKQLAERMKAIVRNGRKVMRVPYLEFLKAMNRLEQPISFNPDIFMPRFFAALSEVMLN
jgi:hypothetical protein